MAHDNSPITAHRVELCLDILAGTISHMGDEGEKLIPMYQRMERELETLKARQDTMSSITARLKRLKDQTVARQS